MSNVDRLLTLKVRIKDSEAAKIIWDAHLQKDTLLAGCKVLAIADGDAIRETEEMEEYLGYLMDKGIYRDPDVRSFEEWCFESDEKAESILKRKET